MRQSPQIILAGIVIYFVRIELRALVPHYSVASPATEVAGISGVEQCRKIINAKCEVQVLCIISGFTVDCQNCKVSANKTLGYRVNSEIFKYVRGNDMNGWRELRQISGNFSRFAGLKEENVMSILILLVFCYFRVV